MACGGSSKFRMAGTQGTGQYIVVAVTPAGKVGYRDLGGGWCGSGGSLRIRVEPANTEAAEKAAKVLTRKDGGGGWKQPGDNCQQRFSLVVAEDAKTVPLCTALAAIGAFDDAVEVNPDLQFWADLMVRDPIQAVLDEVKEEDLSRAARLIAAAVSKLAEVVDAMETQDEKEDKGGC
jgi:hypothetical protein